MIAGVRAQPTVGRSTSPIEALDFKAALGPLRTITAFADGYSNDFGDKTFHCAADARMFSRQRRERTSDTTDDVTAIAFDASGRAELLIQRFAGQGDARSKAPRILPSAQQLFRESLASSSK